MRHELDMFKRSGIKPVIRSSDRLFLVWISRIHKGWKSIIYVVEPETVVRWHRDLFKSYWKKKSSVAKRKLGRPPISQEIKELIRRLSTENPRWGAKRITLELKVKFGHIVARRTVRKYMVKHTGPTPGSTWRAFLSQEAKGIFCCDFFQQPLVNFEVLTVFVFMHLESSKIVHFGVTNHPTLDFVKNSLKGCIAFEEKPKFLIHDNDGIFGQFRLPRNEAGGSFRCHLDQWLFETMGIRGIPTPYGSPKASAFCERIIKTLQTECLDHFIFFNESHLIRTLREFMDYYNTSRTHQGIGGIPDPSPDILKPDIEGAKVVSIPILGGLVNDIRLVA